MFVLYALFVLDALLLQLSLLVVVLFIKVLLHKSHKWYHGALVIIASQVCCIKKVLLGIIQCFSEFLTQIAWFLDIELP